MPSRDEMIAFIRQEAARLGIDPDVAIRVAMSEGLNSDTWSVPDAGSISSGPFQLYEGGGMGNDFKAATGLEPSDQANWKAAITYPLEQVAKGKTKGWAPFYGAKNTGVGQYEGLPGPGPQVAARSPGMARAATAAAPYQGPQQQATAEPAADRRNMWGLTPEEMRDLYDPVGNQTLGGAILDMFSPDDRSKMRASEKSQSALGGLLSLFKGEEGDPEKTEALKKLAEKTNSFSPTPVKDQIIARAKTPTIGSTLANSVFGTTPTPTAQPTATAALDPLKKKKTLGSSAVSGLLSLFG